jgi:hypothetical protein
VALVRVGIFVREAWAGKKFTDREVMGAHAIKVNAEKAGAGGQSGHCVVKSRHGTVEWTRKSKRVQVTKGGCEMVNRLSGGFSY